MLAEALEFDGQTVHVRSWKANQNRIGYALIISTVVLLAFCVGLYFMARTEWNVQRSHLASSAFLFLMEITFVSLLLKKKAHDEGWRFHIEGSKALTVEMEPEQVPVFRTWLETK